MIDGTFLLLSLFFPRIILLIYYYEGEIPYNSVPFLGDFFLSIFLPRVLILIYMVQNDYFGIYFWLHIIFAIGVYSKTYQSKNNSSD